MDRLRVRGTKPHPGTQLPRTQLPLPALEISDIVRPSSNDSGATTFPESKTNPSSHIDAAVPEKEDKRTPCNMLPTRKVRFFLTPPSSPEELTADSSEPRTSVPTSEDELVYVSPIDNLPLATFPTQDTLRSAHGFDDQLAGGLVTATPRPSDTNALGLSLGDPYGEHEATRAERHVLRTVDTWEDICENLCCVLEVSAVLADLECTLVAGSMGAAHSEAESYGAMGRKPFARHGSGRLWNCRVFHSMAF